MTTKTLDIESSINKWGHGLALRINKAVSSITGLDEGAPVLIHAEPGKIVIEALELRPTLEQMLAGFDPVKHGGESMAFKPVGAEKVL
jgi:antitoxin MazE